MPLRSPSKPMSLKETQNLIKKLVTYPGGVEAAIEHYHLDDLPVCSTEKLDAVRRLEIYATAYFVRIHNSLKEDYATVHAMLGDDVFLETVREYLSIYTPKHFSLRYAGQDFASFLETHALRKEFPFLANLAAFEWELLEVFDAADSPVFELSDLAACAPEDWANLHLQLAPSVRMIALQFPVWKLRKHYHQSPEKSFTFEDLRAEDAVVLLWRKEHEVMYRSLEKKEELLLRALQSGKSFAGLCEDFEELIGTSQEELVQLTQSLASWVKTGLLKKVI